EGDRAEAVWDQPQPRRRVLINISAGTSERTWPAENFVAAMRHIAQRGPGAGPRGIAPPAEAGPGGAVAPRRGGTFIRTPSIRDAFALVGTADFVLTPDTSIAHAASAFRKPSVVMFTQGKMERWRLYDTPGLNIEHPEGTLATLGVDRVLAAVDQ